MDNFALKIIKHAINAFMVENKKIGWTDLGFKDKVSFILCIGAFISGIALIIASMYLPPKGIIDPSVITVFGMLLTFTGTILGISQHYKLEHEKLNTEVDGIRAELKRMKDGEE